MKIIKSNDSLNVKVGKAIHNLRKRKGIAQLELAIKLGVSRTTVSLYENGKLEISISKLIKISQILGVSIIDFLKSAEILDNVNNWYSFKDCNFEIEIAIKHYLAFHKKDKYFTNEDGGNVKLKRVITKIKKILDKL